MKTRKLERKEEVVNTITHGVGILIAIACLVLLVVFSSINGNARQTVSFSIFGGSMILLYIASTIYHGVVDKEKKEKLNLYDHSMIYILIAGTYTPLALTVLHDALGWVIFGVVWTLAIVGVVYKFFFYDGNPKARKISAILYILMGWIGIFAIVPLIHSALPETLWFLLSGGISYSLGVLFYLWEEMPYGHAIFHLFILGGSICHFFAFLVTVL